MYREGGSASIEEDHPLARCWRDIQVVGQAIGLLLEVYVFSGAPLARPRDTNARRDP
jgi:hypothetical protein